MGAKKVKLKELLIILRNGANIRQFEDAKGLPITRIETISDATINPLKVGYANIFNDKYQDYYLKEGDILLSHINSVAHLGKCAIYNNSIGKLIHGMNLLMLRVNKELVLPKYLYYVLNSKQFKAKLPKITKKSVNQASMTITDIGNLNLIIEEDINQQQKIVDILDKADEIRQKKKLANDKLDEFLKSTFIDMFGDPETNEKHWESGIVRDIVKEARYGTSSKAGSEGTYPILRMGNLTYNGAITLNNLKYIDLKAGEVDKYIVKKGDILFNRTNSKELVGKTAVFRNEEPMAFAGYLVRVRTNEKANAEFLSAFMNSDYMKRILQLKCKNIVGMANINAQEMQDFEIYIPPIELQNRFAQMVEKIEARKQKNELVMEQMNNLFNSLSQKAFKGEL